MYVSEIEIYNFKAFQGESSYKLNLSRHLNCIAGHNGVGKSTILAILSNCGELRKQDGAQINGKAFRGEYSQLIKGDRENDTSGKKATLRFSDLPESTDDENPFVPKLDFRATFQNARRTEQRFKLVNEEQDLYEKKKEIVEYERYRLIPVIQNNLRETEKKLNWPVIYLGLTRLFPIGESEDVTQAQIPEDILTKLQDNHKSILSSYDEYLESSQIGITDTSKKSGFGVTTKNYSHFSNSSGQDNLGQILLAVYSFEKLKSEYPEYSGGILLIDEIDATLHPAAQNNLIDFLLEKSIELDLQIVFTSHSQSLMEHLNFRRRNNKNRQSLKINYLENSTDEVKIIKSPDDNFIKKDLFNTYSNSSLRNDVTIFTEDDVGEWILKSILEIKEFPHLRSIKFNTSSIGWTALVKFIKNNYHIFNDVIIFLDPDLSIENNKDELEGLVKGTMYRQKINVSNGRIFYLELGDYIEKIFWEYLSSLEPDHEFYLIPNIQMENYSARTVEDNGPYSIYYENFETEQEKIKNWFQDNSYLIENLFPYWYQDSEEEVDKFYQNFCSAFYNISKK